MTSSHLPVHIVKTVSFQVVHSTTGRMRIRIPRLAYDAAYASQLHWLTDSLAFTIHVRINPPASSLIVHYAIAQLSVTEVEDRLFTAIQQAVTFKIPHLPEVPSSDMSANLRGMGWMLLATGSFAGMQTAIRFVAGGIHPFQIAFLSNLFGIGILLPWLTDSRVLKTEKLHLHGIRAMIDTGATLLLFTGLSLIPLAQANALGFTAPLFAILGAVLFLKERMQPQTWVALVLGIVGTLIILRPGLEIVGVGAILILGGSVALAGVLLLLKVLSETDSSLTSNIYTVLFLTPLTLIPALFVWQMPTLMDLAGLVVVAALMVGGQMAVAKAFEEADATVVLPVDFAQLIWASWLGYLVFAEVPDLWTLLGGLLIFAGSTYAAYAENVTQPESAEVV